MNATETRSTQAALTAKGNEYEALIYVDPFPGRKGAEVISEECGNCGGSGMYYGRSGYEFFTPTEGTSTTGCFRCMGTGKNHRKVSSARTFERRYIASENTRRADAADWAADAPAREALEAAQELLKAEAEAKAEAARLAAMVQGYEAEIGTRIRNVACEVITEYQYEAVAFNGYSMELRAIIVLRAIESGKTLKWSTGARGLERGAIVSVTGTVKAHEEYKGQEQTVLTRCIIK